MCPSGDSNVNNYGDPNNVRNCYLVGLTDLYGALDYVRNAVAGYLNSLVALGVAGIRIDAAKHMWTEDIAAITSGVNNLPTEHGFAPNSKLFVYSEVIDRNDEARQARHRGNTNKPFLTCWLIITASLKS
jgi:alpha-amylase